MENNFWKGLSSKLHSTISASFLNRNEILKFSLPAGLTSTSVSSLNKIPKFSFHISTCIELLKFSFPAGLTSTSVSSLNKILKFSFHISTYFDVFPESE